MVGIIAGIIGGRILVIISESHLYHSWLDWFALWQGGFSILGTILGVIIILPFYLKKINVPILPFADLVALYAPLCQSIARLGCLVAGCCYGKVTNNFYAIIYTNQQTLAPYNIPLHPTQLYSSLLLFIIFIFLYFIGQRITKKTGQLFILYLFLACLERFFMDFLRADRVMLNSFISFHQTIAVCIIIFLIIFNYCLSFINTKK